VDPICSPTTGKRSSRFQGISRHQWTGRYEAQLWDKMSSNVTRKRKENKGMDPAYSVWIFHGEQPNTSNLVDVQMLESRRMFEDFYAQRDEDPENPPDGRKKELESLVHDAKTPLYLGLSKYKGVARQHYNGKWEASIGRVFGNKYLYI
ncbi:Hypothetical predicted protein, partial [Olea europaea subsp. europaea]